MAIRTPRGYGQYDGVARALERVGDRWALLIVRDLLVGARRYGDLKTGLARIPTNILSDRLKELQEAGVIRRVPTVRGGYELTPLGRALEPVVVALERWGWSALGAPAEGEVLTADAATVALRAAFRTDVAADAAPTRFVLHVAGLSLDIVVADGVLDVIPVGPDALPQPHRPSANRPNGVVTELTLTASEFGDLLAGRLETTAMTPSSEPEAFALVERLFRIDQAAASPEREALSGDASVA